MSTDLRRSIAEAVRGRVAGPDAAARAAELWAAPGPRWFADDRPILRIHADASMFVGGLRALLFQSLHPLAMAGVAAHSDYRHDPWGRLQRTADFLAATTYGPAEQAEAAVSRVRTVHRRVKGSAADGRPYSAGDPHLLRWVHVVEVDSFLRAYARFGAEPLTDTDADGYVEDMAVIARALGIPDPPIDQVSLHDQIEGYRDELGTTPEARAAARFLLAPPMSLVSLAPYAVLFGASVAMLPWWARLGLGLPPLTPVSDTVVRAAAGGLVDVLRWALASDPRPTAAA